MTAIRPMLTRTCRPLALTTALALAALTSPAHAADECGALPTTEGERTIACTSDTYTPDTDKNGVDNIFYEIGSTDTDYTFTIHGDLTIKGRRSNKGQAREGGVGYGPLLRPNDYPIVAERNRRTGLGDEGDAVYYGDGTVGDDGDGLDADGDGVWDNGEGPQDDHGRRNYTPGGVLTNPRTPVVSDPPNTQYAGIFIDTHQDFDGTITLRSEADITVDHEPFSTDRADLRMGRREGLGVNHHARGLSVQHYGTSGNLDLTVGGTITSPGAGIWAEIDSLADKVTGSTVRDIDFVGDIDIHLLPSLRIRTTAEDGHGVQAYHRGTGAITLTARNPTLSTNPDIATAGFDASGIVAELGNRSDDPGDSPGGDITIDLTNIWIKTTGGHVAGQTRQGSWSLDPPASSDQTWASARGFKLYNFNRGKIDLDLTGSKVETEGVRAQGIYAVYFASGLRGNPPARHAPLPQHATVGGDIEIALRRTDLTTTGDYADGILAYHGSTGAVDIDVDGGSTIETTGVNAHAIAGLHHGTGDVAIDARGRITTTGVGSDGIRGGHRGVGDIAITARSATITTTGTKADGIHAFHLGVNTAEDLTKHDQAAQADPVPPPAGTGPWELFDAVAVRDTPAETDLGLADRMAIRVTVDGGSIVACDPDADGTCQSLDAVGIRATFGPEAQNGHAHVTIRNGARVQGTDAVRFEGGRGTLVLADSTLIGGIRFATGTYDDTLDVMGQGGVDGPIAFDAGTDTLTLDIARGQHFIFGGEITNLETLTLQGGGFARFAAPVNLVAPGTATVTDGTLVLASGLTSRTVTISAKGRLVLEAGLDSSDQLTYGQIASGTVHFAGDPVVFAQLAPDLTADQIRTVREQLAAASLTRADLLPTTLTQGDDNTDLTMGTIVIRSTQADGTVVDVGTIAADGTITLDANRIAQLVLPEPVPAPPRPATLGPRHRLVAALPAVLLDMTALEAPSAGPGTWARLLGSTADRTRKDATVPTAYDLVRRGVALGHGLELGPGRTLGLAVQHQTGSATVTNGGTIDVTATTLGVRHAWALEATTLGLAASATTLASDLAVTGTGRLAAGLSGTGLTAGLRADHRLALPDDATVTLGADLTHARVKADAFTTEAATKEQATAIKGSATTLALTADWTTPRPTGAVFAGARLALPLGGTAQARVGTTALTSKPRPALGVQGGIAFGGTAITLGYGRESGGDSLAASLTHRF